MSHAFHGDFKPADFFVLRTPLLPFDALEALGQGLKGPLAEPSKEALEEALTADRAQLRKSLEEWLDLPEVKEALFLASPSLEQGLAAWKKNPESKKGRRAEQALIRYVYRMAARPTPFGLFSGCSTGRITDGETRLQVAPRSQTQRHTRIDSDYLFALTETLGRDESLRRRLTYRPSTSLYQSAGKLRYVEPRVEGSRRVHHLVALDVEDYLLDVLEQARAGASIQELSQGLADREEVGFEDAETFIFELVDNQVLVSDLTPPVTGKEPLDEVLAQLRRYPETRHAAQVLDNVHGHIRSLDEKGLGNDTQHYHRLAQRLSELPPKVEMSRLLQTDMMKPAPQASLSTEVIAELARGVGMIRRLLGPTGETEMDRFRKEFESRYEGGRRVPLMEALDNESGIGFGRSRPTSSLLQGLPIARAGANSYRVPWGRRQELLLSKILEAREQGSMAVEITEEDLSSLPTAELPPLPPAFHVMATLGRESEDSESKIFFRNLGGPSGVNLLGRFCHGDEDLKQRVEAHLQAEEAQDPDTIFAEVVHLPQGRMGNVLVRPVMRQWEIPYLGRGSADPEHQIPLDDLLVTVEKGQVVLYSKRLQRRVLPRLTSAHSFTYRALDVYRFLGLLQQQGYHTGLAWQWGPFESLDFLPRVTSGRLVLTRARWRVRKDELDRLAAGDENERFAAVQAWRRRLALPRHVALVDSDNELVVDLDNTLSIEGFLATVKRRFEIEITELFPGPGELAAHSADGRFTHEVLIPFMGTAKPSENEDAVQGPGPSAEITSSRPAAAVAGTRRTFLPGSEWLYAKLYTGIGSADEILTHTLGPLTRELQASGAVDRWFFLRYSDSGWHLRLRLHGEPARLAAEALPALERATAPLLADGRLRRLQLDTYERELERYGAGEAMELSEALFHHDSEAVLGVLRASAGDAGADHRWLLAARGIDRMLADFGYDLERAGDILGPLKTAFGNEMGAAVMRKQLADRLRRERGRLEAVLEPVYAADHPLVEAYRALDIRSQRVAPILRRLQELDTAGRLGVAWHHLVRSHIHMFTNRVLRVEGRAHEMVLYDFLDQLTRSRLAKRRAAARRAAGAESRSSSSGSKGGPKRAAGGAR